MSELTFGQMREEAKKQGFEPIPIGTYNFKIEKANIKKGSGGNSQIQIKIVVMDGPLAGQNTVTRLVFYKNDGDVNGMVYRQLKSLGIGDDHPVWAQVDAVGLEQGIGSIAQLVVGGMFVGDIDHQIWNGENRDNLKNMKPYGSGGLVPTGPTGVAGAVPTAPVAPAPAPVAPVPVVAPVDPVPVAPVDPVPVAAPVAPAPAPVPPAPATAPPLAPAPQPVVEEAAIPVAPAPMEAVTSAPDPIPAPQPVPVAAPVPVIPVPPDPEADPF